jgi:gluconate 2-dehydrogenase gamma chain
MHSGGEIRQGGVMTQLSRRLFLKTAGSASIASGVLGMGAVGVASGAEVSQKGGKPSAALPTANLFFNPQEAVFIEAACARLIPLDELGPGAVEAGVPNYLDKQLAGAWGAGERLYRSGPWQAGAPTQGYQLPFTPAELFRNALRGIAADLKAQGRDFTSLSGEEQDAYLKALEAGGKDFNGVPSEVFFQILLSMTVEGYFSDPVYGGNKDMAAWKMIGFPGAYANYYDVVDKHGIKFTRAPMSIADAPPMEHMHHGPDIPARL